MQRGPEAGFILAGLEKTRARDRMSKAHWKSLLIRNFSSLSNDDEHLKVAGIFCRAMMYEVNLFNSRGSRP